MNCLHLKIKKNAVRKTDGIFMVWGLQATLIVDPVGFFHK